MFTGLIEETGTIQQIKNIAGGKKIVISAEKILSDIKVDDSISVSGVCLTVIEYNKKKFTVEAVGETLQKSTIADLKINDSVNLERALRLNDRLGGHFVQGHVNGIGRISRLEKRGDNWFVEISIPVELEKYVIEEGSIAIDGVSLTIAKLNNNFVGISVIPHTFKNTVISNYRIDTAVNVETDFFAKYIEKILLGNNTGSNGILTEAWLKKMGY